MKNGFYSSPMWEEKHRRLTSNDEWFPILQAPQKTKMYLDCSQHNWCLKLWLKSNHGTQSSLCERRAVTNEECSPILHHSGKSMSPKTPQSGLLEEADGTKNALQFFAAPRKSSAQSVHRRWSKQLFWIQVVSSLVHLLGVFGSVGWWRC